MAARTGAQLLAGLKQDRNLWLGREKVRDIAEHPAFAGAARALAGVYDLQHRHAADCLMPDPETGEPINVSHMVPRSKDDLKRRHAGLERIAEYTVGVMGRTPDYMNVTYAGFAGCSDEWAKAGNEEGAARLVAYQKRLRREDWSLTHTIIHPTTDKSRGDAIRVGDEVPLHKVGETAHGIVVRGARVLATLAPFADELAVYPGRPLPDGAEKYALSFCVPMTAPGLKFLCRDSYAGTRNVFDHPLSSRFDEQDAFVVFDDVEVPWDRVFIDGNVETYNHVMGRSWGPNITQQTMVRAQTKLEFAWGLASRMAEVVNDTNPATAQLLGEIWSYAELTRAAIHAAEDRAREFSQGVWFPAGAPFLALRAALPGWMPRVAEIFQLIGSHNLLATPTLSQLEDPELRPMIDQYLRGAGDHDAQERTRVFRLAWDFAGSSLATRGVLYERFYLGSAARIYQTAHQAASRKRANALVDRFLDEPLDGSLP